MYSSHFTVCMKNTQHYSLAEAAPLKKTILCSDGSRFQNVDTLVKYRSSDEYLGSAGVFVPK